MNEEIRYHYIVDGDDFKHAGQASSDLKKKLKQMHIPPEIIRRAAIAMYEGEINMVIHADGGTIDVTIDPEAIRMTLTDHGPGIPDVDQAMKEGFTTATINIMSMGFGAGMGLPNMKKSSDEMTIDTTVGEGTTVRMTIYMKG